MLRHLIHHPMQIAIILGIIIGLVTGAAPLGWVYQKRKSRMSKFEEGIPEALELIVSALRVGHSLNAAMGLVSRECPDPVGGEFRVTFDEMNYGLELKSALDNLVTRVPIQDVKIVCTAILIQRESGGNLDEDLIGRGGQICHCLILKNNRRAQKQQTRIAARPPTASLRSGPFPAIQQQGDQARKSLMGEGSTAVRQVRIRSPEIVASQADGNYRDRTPARWR